MTFLAMVGFSLACGSSESEPPDPLAVAYCEECSPFPGCPDVVGGALQGGCPELTRAYYACVTNNLCETTSCAAEWDARQVCLFGPRDEEPTATPAE